MIGRKRKNERQKVIGRGVHGGGSQDWTAEIHPSKTDGQDPSVHDRTTANGNDDVGDKKRLLRQRLGIMVDRVHGGGLRKQTAEINLSKTDGQDRSSPRRSTRRSTGHGDDDVSGGVITDNGSTAHAHRRTTTWQRERRAPTRCGRHGELTGDQSSGGRSTDGDGGEEEAAETFGLTTTAVLRRPTATTEGWTRSAMAWRSRRWPSRATTTTGAATTHG